MGNDQRIYFSMRRTERIDGRTAIGFGVDGSDMSLTIWADPETSQAMRIEMMKGQTHTILTNIRFEMAANQLLVSMDVPEELDEMLQITCSASADRSKQCNFFYLTLRHGIRTIESR